MAEIILPTKAQQDAIKQDTTNILSQFPISGGFNPGDYTPFAKSVVPPITKTQMINITGGGYLACAVLAVPHNNTMNGLLNIVLDGVSIFDSPETLMQAQQGKGITVLDNVAYVDGLKRLKTGGRANHTKFVETLPFVGTTTELSPVHFMLQPILFEESLVIEALAGNNSIVLDVVGGIKNA